LLGELLNPRYLLVGNQSQRIQLVVLGSHVAYYRDGENYFAYDDPEAYTSGWFAFRTAHNHMTVRAFRVFRVEEAQ
jgi:hypothetical protein